MIVAGAALYIGTVGIVPAHALFGPEAEKTHTSSKLIRVSGGGAAINWIFAPIHDIFEEESGIDLETHMVGPGSGLVDLLQGKADVATGAASLEEMILFAEKAGLHVNPSELHQATFGTNKTLVYLHNSNPITKLSKEQLKGIFTGKITNWRDIGGQDKSIVVVWGSKTPAQNALFSKEILDGEPVTPAALQATDYRDILDKVSAEPAALGIDPSGFVSGVIHVPETPELKSPIIVVTRGKPSPEIEKLLVFLGEVATDLAH
jgi:phosphate transport system substrate-binding protein